MDSTTEKHWYLVQCKPKQDLRALEHLQHQGYECLLPMHKFERLKKGQWRIHEEPLFPGYLFIELDTLQDNWMPIRSTRGVSQIVRFGADPVPVPINIIERIRNTACPIEHELQPGDRVIVNWDGSQGMEAIFLTKDGTERVLILLRLLQREVKVSAPLKGLLRVG
ncbi:MAG: transcription/translation regulatory transformer protein RfaH [Pseudomonas sp.]|uniref:transcription/translation regulatory transformer protein RfaH n=1 Tax=Pseudomonas sp. TaxID=306 RepID=UPI000CB7E267|nr:transcription/translation regulatory transformer protein RfaH [Pseudomonas sp.]PJI50997.1 MAG: transcription/translation regulatory transformer protein RfaH [Pseudomonas sp.]